jgi:cold shock CspA family protein
VTTAAAAKVYVGKVKWFQVVQGYGFILSEAFPGNVFVHHSDLLDGKVPTQKHKYVDDPVKVLCCGQEVQFEVRMEDRGPRAVKVSVVGWREA